MGLPPTTTQKASAAKPRIEVLGVHRLKVTQELFEEQFSISYGSLELTSEELEDAREAIQEQLAFAVLLEVRVVDRDERFSVDHFTQPRADLPSDRWQVAWAEAYLTPDGHSLAVERWSRATPAGNLRIAFFIHFWDPSLSLATSYGEIVCPEPTAMPERLAELVPYEPLS